MKKFLKNVVFQLLATLARIRLRRIRPCIIGVTGSVGKTSTKDAIYTLLKSRFKIIRNEKSYNTEFGLPLAILGQASGFSSAWQWGTILLTCCWRAFFGGRKTEMMVLEMGVDKPKDMDVLLSIVKPRIGIITSIKPVHLGPGQFHDLEAILNEKGKLLRSLPAEGTAIFNVDDNLLRPLRTELTCKTLTYGKDPHADLRILSLKSTRQGIAFSLQYRHENASAELKLHGLFQMYVVLPAIATVLVQGFSLQEACAGLRDYRLPPGRMNVLEGIHDTWLIDSSYNASPETMQEALKVLKDFEPASLAKGASESSGRRIAVLGSMNELGDSAEKYHRLVGEKVFEAADLLCTVGEQARWIAEGAQGAGMPATMIHRFADVEAAIAKLPSLLQKNDMILVKGSQNKVRLEKLLKVLLRDASKAPEVLVRQEKNW